MDDTIGLEKQDITFFEGIKTSCERLNRTMHKYSSENIKTTNVQQ
jgi:hypothetical protein